MCMKVKAEVNASDIKLGVKENVDSCPIARTLKRDGFKNVRVEADSISGVKFNVKWIYEGNAHNRFIQLFDDDKTVQPRSFNFSFEPLEVIEQDTNTEL